MKNQLLLALIVAAPLCAASPLFDKHSTSPSRREIERSLIDG
jgi:hypothetical protein